MDNTDGYITEKNNLIENTLRALAQSGEEDDTSKDFSCCAPYLSLIVSKFLSSINKAMKKASLRGNASITCHIVCGKYSKLARLNGEPTLYVGDAIRKKCGRHLTKKDIASFIATSVEEIYTKTSSMEVSIVPGSRHQEYYALDYKPSSVESAIDIDILWIPLDDYDTIRTRDVYDSDADAFAAGVPLADIFA